MIAFLRPDYARWIVVVPLAFALWLIHALYRSRARRRSRMGPTLVRLSQLTDRRHEVLGLLLVAAALTLGVAAMMRPTMVLTRRVPFVEKQDLILILDRSISMHAQDVLPSRYARAVIEIRQFLRAKPETIDRVGLIGFAENAVVLSYLTSDVGSVMFYLDWLQQDSQVLFGTNMGAALQLALGVAEKDHAPNHRIFVLLSDGEDQSKEVVPAIDALRARALPVYTIGIGSEAEAFIPVSRLEQVLAVGESEDSDASPNEVESGQVLTTRFNETTLRWIANATGGKYARSLTGHDLSAMLARVAAREARILGHRSETRTWELYPVLILGVLVCLTGAICLL